MYERTPVYQALDRALLSSGLQPDLQQLTTILWAEAFNVRFYQGKVVRNVPSALMFDTSIAHPRSIQQLQDSSGVRWIWVAGRQEVKRWYAPSVEDIYTFPTAGIVDQTSQLDATFPDMVPYGDWMILNNGLDAPQVYKPGTGVAALASDAPIALLYMKKFNFLMAFGYGERGTRVGWSDADNIEEWTAATENLAGSLTIDDFDTRIKAAARLGQNIAVLNDYQLATVFFTGDQYVFGQRFLLDGIGAVGKRAVASDQRGLFGVSRNGIWWTDGNSSRYIDEGYLHDYLQDTVNWGQSSKIQAARNDMTGCLDFYFPMLGSNILNEGWSFDPATQGWSTIPPVQAQQERKLFAAPLQFGYKAGGGSQLRLMANNPDVAAALNLKTKGLLMQYRSAAGFEDIHTDVAITEVVLHMKEVANVRFRLESQERAGGDWQFADSGGWQTVLPGSVTYLIENMPSGTLWRLVFESTADNWDFNLQGFQFFAQLEGTKRK